MVFPKVYTHFAFSQKEFNLKINLQSVLRFVIVLSCGDIATENPEDLKNDTTRTRRAIENLSVS